MPHDMLNLGPDPEKEENAETGQPAGHQTPQPENPAPQPPADNHPPAREAAPARETQGGPGFSPREKQFYNLVDGPYMEPLLGKKYGVYRQIWGRMFKNAGNINNMAYLPSLNIPAMVFGCVWSAYRGVWVLLGIQLFIAFAATAHDLLTNETHILISWGAQAASGLFANGLFFQKMRKEAEALQRSNASEYAALGCKAGHGSWWRMIWVSLVFYVALGIGQRVEEKILLSMGYDVSFERVYVEPYQQMLQQQRYRQYQRGY